MSPLAPANLTGNSPAGVDRDDLIFMQQHSSRTVGSYNILCPPAQWGVNILFSSALWGVIILCPLALWGVNILSSHAVGS